MPKRRNTPRVPCVPVSTTGAPSSSKGSQLGPVGLNSMHEARLITSLVDYYGWTLCSDGNLYNPFPANQAEGSDAA